MKTRADWPVRSGEGEIRTPEEDKPLTGFRDQPVQPLWHLSGLRGMVAPGFRPVNAAQRLDSRGESWPARRSDLNIPETSLAQGRRPHARGLIIAAICPRISSGSLIRPAPTVRHACHPLSGPMNLNPSSESI